MRYEPSHRNLLRSHRPKGETVHTEAIEKTFLLQRPRPKRHLNANAQALQSQEAIWQFKTPSSRPQTGFRYTGLLPPGHFRAPPRPRDAGPTRPLPTPDQNSRFSSRCKILPLCSKAENACTAGPWALSSDFAVVNGRIGASLAAMRHHIRSSLSSCEDLQFASRLALTL